MIRFKLNSDNSKTISFALRSLLEQARERQFQSPAKSYVETLLHYLVGAMLDLALPNANVIHNGSVAVNRMSNHAGNFEIDDVVIHCTTSPTEELLYKCHANVKSDRQPLILTTAEMLSTAESYAASVGLGDRVEVMDAIQFIAANLYKRCLLGVEKHETALERLVHRYNKILAADEADTCLCIEIR